MEIVKSDDVPVATRNESESLSAEFVSESCGAATINEYFDRDFLSSASDVAPVVHHAVCAAANERKYLVAPIKYLPFRIARKRHAKACYNTPELCTCTLSSTSH